MGTIIAFLKNLMNFFISINANAFWTIIYFLSQNWFMLTAIIFMVIMMIIEIKIKSDDIIDDERKIY